jgi:hypothetical protein
MHVSTTMVAPLLVIALADPATAQRWSVYRAPPPSHRIDLPTRPLDTGTSANIPQPAIGRQLDGIDDGIRAGRASGQLSRREARGLRRENGVIGSIAERNAENGLSQSEARELQIRTEVMRDIVNNQRLRAKP